MTIYLGIGAACGLTLLGYFAYEVLRHRGCYDVGCSLVAGVVLGALCVVAWPLALVGLAWLSYRREADRHDVREARG
jgi:hypothetical protein